MMMMRIAVSATRDVLLQTTSDVSSPGLEVAPLVVSVVCPEPAASVTLAAEHAGVGTVLVVVRSNDDVIVEVCSVVIITHYKLENNN